MIDSNWHTHTYRCKHAQGDVEDYCREAQLRGLKTLGFSDHAPLPDGRWHSVRMGMDELESYCQAIDAARRQFPGLSIRKGLECEYIPELEGLYRDRFLGACGMDYLVGGAHWYPHQGSWTPIYGTPMDARRLRDYVDYLVASLQSGLFAFIAHPDLFGLAYTVWDSEAVACSRALLEAASTLRIPLEINGYGMRKGTIETPSGPRLRYPWLPFWELAAECGVQAVLSSDAHEPETVAAGLVEGEEIARRFGLEVVADPLAAAGPREQCRATAETQGGIWHRGDACPAHGLGSGSDDRTRRKRG
jgi:histidinol-phosphatase (PHP family)